MTQAHNLAFKALGVSRLFVIRHGEQRHTSLNATDVIPTDDTNTLTIRGIEQSKSIGSQLAAALTVGHCRLYTSPAARCRETAGLIAARVKVDPQVDSRLSDRMFDPKAVRNGADLREWQVRSWLAPYKLESGESVAKHRARILDFLSELFDEMVPADVAIVTHGTCIEHIFSILMGSSLQTMEFSFAACDVGRGHLWTFENTVNGVRTAVLQAVNTSDFCSG